MTLLVGMAVLAVLSLLFALSTAEARREHAVHPRREDTLLVPLAARVGLGIYLLSLVGTVLWDWHRHRQAGAAGAPPQPLRARWGTPILAAVVLIGVGLLLLSIQTRPARHPRTDYSGDAAVRAVPPAEWTALGYLPDDTNLVVGVHVAEALRHPAGQELLTHSPPGVGEVRLTQIEDLTGLKLSEIDYAVLGLRLEDQPKGLLVVQTVRPYDVRQVVQALKAARVASAGGRTWYSFTPEKLRWLPGYLGCPDDRTLLISLTRDFERVPRTPRPGIDHLAPDSQTFIKERLRSAPQFWAVGHVDHWDKTLLSLLLSTWEGWPVLAQVRTFGTWWQCDEGLTVRAAFRSVSAAAARDLEKYLVAEENGENKMLRGLGLGGDGQRIPRALAATLTARQEGDWVLVEAEAGPDIMQPK